MTAAIRCLDPTEPAPRRLELALRCDGHHPQATAVFRESAPTGQGFRRLRQDAHDAGWRWTDNDRVLGPCCPPRNAP